MTKVATIKVINLLERGDDVPERLTDITDVGRRCVVTCLILFRINLLLLPTDKSESL